MAIKIFEQLIHQYYPWSDGSTSQTISDLGEGVYEVDVFDSSSEFPDTTAWKSWDKEMETLYNYVTEPKPVRNNSPKATALPGI